MWLIGHVNLVAHIYLCYIMFLRSYFLCIIIHKLEIYMFKYSWSWLYSVLYNSMLYKANFNVHCIIWWSYISISFKAAKYELKLQKYFYMHVLWKAFNEYSTLENLNVIQHFIYLYCMYFYNIMIVRFISTCDMCVWFSNVIVNMLCSSNSKDNKSSILFYSILFYSILFYSILFF